MSKGNSNKMKKETDSIVNKLNSRFSKLTVRPNEISALLSLNEYYYEYGLNNAEELAALPTTVSPPVQATMSPKKRKRDNSKKQKKKEERLIKKVESITGKLKNITITVNNDEAASTSTSSSSSASKKSNDKDAKINPLQTLRLLQSGKITSETIMTAPLKIPKVRNRESKVEESIVEEAPKAIKNDFEKNREEINELNRRIRAKIGNQIKPRLREITDGTDKNGLIESRRVKTTSESSQSNQLPKLMLPAITDIDEVSFVIPKTKVVPPSSTVEVEIYRYTFEQLYQLQQFSTWQYVGKLMQLKICKTQLPPLDEFLLTILGLPDTERNEIILKKSAERQLIKRKGFNDYEFMSPTFIGENEGFARVDNSLPRIEDDGQKRFKQSLDHIDRFRLIAKNDEELNELIYQHEFINLFESALKDQDLNDQSHANIISHLIESNQAFIIEGEIRVNQRNCQEAYVSHRKGVKDICINSLVLRRHAFHGDLVRVLVKKDSSNDDDILTKEPSEQNTLDEDLNEAVQSESRNFGCVLEILDKRHSRRVIGTFAPFTNLKKNRKHLLVNVRDSKVPNVRVCTRSGIPTDTELSDKLLLTVEITNWSYDQPQGRVVSVIGKKGQLKTENIAILQQNNLDPKPFEQSILYQLPKEESFQIPAKEFEYRQDLRKKCIFSIDPESARDLDDALSLEVLPNGNYEVGVHISDVSYFVKENSDLDMIVKDKATTIYLVDAVYHMLPEQLCFLCSLLPGADKLAYSVFFEMNPNTAEIYDTRYTRSIINSCAKLSYDHAQMVIEKKDQNWSDIENEFPQIHNGFSVSHVADVIFKLQKLAIILRANRKANGALKIDQPKLSFKFEKDDQRMEVPVDFFKYCTKDSNRLIEEFMLLANISVASFIYQKYPNVSLLRHHDVPNENALKKLVKVLNKHNIKLDTSSSVALSKSMESLITFARNPNGMNAAINVMVSKTMTRANYFCSNIAESPDAFWHYALSIPIYTHFTSPIRRYADILVHRVLNAALNYEEITSRTPEEIQELAVICNAQKYNAKLAGEDSSDLYFMHFIQSLKTKMMSAGVLGIYEFNLEVILIDTGHILKIYYKNLQQSDDVFIKTFIDSSPPYITCFLPKLQCSMKIEFGMEILVQLEVLKDKLIVNKIFYNQNIK